MKIVFFGTSAFAAHILEYLFQKNLRVVGVVTRPDRPFGRSLRVSSPPVKEVCRRLKPDLPLLQPEKASAVPFAEVLKTFDADLFVVVAYGEIQQNILDIPKKGAINVHASLLPHYRGAAPMQRCLMDGCTETGVTIMQMVLEMDAGDMLEVAKLPLPQEMTCGELELKLQELACPALLKVVRDYEEGAVKKIPQNPKLVTFAPKITPQEEEIFWAEPAEKIHNQIRALAPRPGAWCLIKIGQDKKRLKIKRSQVIPDQKGAAGEILSQKEEFIVACEKGALRLLEVQLEGKKTLSAIDFLRGLQEQLLFNF